MKFHIIIPARLESCRLQKKLLLDKSGTTLINHTVLRAIEIVETAPELFSSITVAADDESIISTVNSIKTSSTVKVRAVMTSIDHKSGSDRIAEAINIAGITEGALINIQGDEPEIPIEVVVGFAKFISALPDFQMATLAYPLIGSENILNPNLVKVVTDSNNNALYFSRSAIPYSRDCPNGTPASALGHIGIYAYRISVIKKFVELDQGTLEINEKLEQLRALENGIPIAVQVLKDSLPKGIDTEADYQDFLNRL